MTDKDLQTVFKNYLAAFCEPYPGEREMLIRENVAENISFSNPGVNGAGRKTLLSHIATFQDRFPDGRFRINWIKQQHGQVLAEWTQFNADGTEFLTAHSYARIGEDGRITQFAGFWE